MNYSLYIHIPFCQNRCHYCDFNTNTGKEALIPVYVEALANEIADVGVNRENLNIHSIYFGGGTPSLLPIHQYEIIFATINNHYLITADCEVTLEANPGTLSNDYLSQLKNLGFNRISLGAQSMKNFDLLRLDRIHNVDDIFQSYKNARNVGFENINLDLIFSLPWQDLTAWEQSLETAISFAPEHFSLYSLILEPGTKLYQWYLRGLIAEQDQDLEGEMFERAMELLEQAGYEHYEISNWAKIDINKDYQCRHNRQYWLNRPYLGFGAGAHGYAGGIRTENEPNLEAYITRLNTAKWQNNSFPKSPATITLTPVDKQTQMKDFMLLGLRLLEEGVSTTRFADWYGQKMDEVFSKEINQLLDQGLIMWVGGVDKRLRLTQRGVMVANHVFMQFI